MKTSAWNDYIGYIIRQKGIIRIVWEEPMFGIDHEGNELTVNYTTFATVDDCIMRSRVMCRDHNFIVVSGVGTEEDLLDYFMGTHNAYAVWSNKIGRKDGIVSVI